MRDHEGGRSHDADLSAAEQLTNDSTRAHIDQVAQFIGIVRLLLEERTQQHDASKLTRPEVEIFTTYTPKLAASTYGSDEYKQFLAEMKPALAHHYAHNRHHPEHFEDGVNDMTLIDVIEMVCDWKAATLRHQNGDIRKSIEINQERFGISPQLSRIILNTIEELGW
jgi:hypothetical protein